MRREQGPFRDVPYTGVIYVVAEAMKLGYDSDHPDWCNLGQGMPEVGVLPGAPARAAKVEIDVRDLAYGPVPGIPELRQRVAELYNHWYRHAGSCCSANSGPAQERQSLRYGPAFQ
jgi:aspartate/methionine/tyrosine aminotransferase